MRTAVSGNIMSGLHFHNMLSCTEQSSIADHVTIDGYRTPKIPKDIVIAGRSRGCMLLLVD
jgi:hypothetical protein